MSILLAQFDLCLTQKKIYHFFPLCFFNSSLRVHAICLVSRQYIANSYRKLAVSWVLSAAIIKTLV